MLLRIGILLALLVPGFALAQTPTITITQKGDNANTTTNQMIINLGDCDDLDTSIDSFDVAVDLSTALLTDPTISIKLGKDTCPTANCVNIVTDEPITQAQQTFNVSLSIQGFIDAAVSADAACPDADEKLFLFVDIDDTTGNITSEKGENIFVDTKAPVPPETLSASGGEGILHVDWESNDSNIDGDLSPEEHDFIVECRLTGTSDAFKECGSLIANGTGPFTTDITALDGQDLENGVGIDFQVITVDTAGNQSAPSATAIGTPQDVLDFGENYHGSEGGGCSVGHQQSQLLWVGLLVMAIFFLRKPQRKA